MGKKLIFKIFILFLLLIFHLALFGVNVVLAKDGATKAAADAPAVTTEKSQINPSYPWSGAKNMADLVSKFYNIALAAAGVAALGAIVYGGILYTASAGSTSAQAEAREWIKGAVLGLALLLGAVLLLNTIGITETGPGGGAIIKEPEIPEIPVPPEPSPEPSPKPSEKLSEKQVMAQLDKGWIGYKTINTSYEGMRQKTVDEIVSLGFDAQKGGIGVHAVYVTGGTEKGPHAESGEYTHVNGYKFDVVANDKITKMIKDNYTPLKKSDPGCFTDMCYRSSRGAIYNKEPNQSGGGFHWDVLVK